MQDEAEPLPRFDFDLEGNPFDMLGFVNAVVPDMRELTTEDKRQLLTTYRNFIMNRCTRRDLLKIAHHLNSIILSTAPDDIIENFWTEER
tara:strand:- start:591 stop:860 length:270 start_codon:yes stop_codon:yes gene_type:complete